MQLRHRGWIKSSIAGANGSLLSGRFEAVPPSAQARISEAGRKKIPARYFFLAVLYVAYLIGYAHVGSVCNARYVDDKEIREILCQGPDNVFIGGAANRIIVNPWRVLNCISYSCAGR
jgi:hypothetical protein